MKYYSTNRNANVVDFKTATIQGLAPDNGLYFPDNIPVFSKDYFENLKNLSVTEIAYNMLQPYVDNSIDSNTLTDIIVEAFNFEIPLVNLTDEISVLELFHGPTLAFKDIGARFMSRCLSYFVKNENNKTIVLVATSGDTGGAVADGFFGVDGVDVVILYPKGKVSLVQEKQMAALGGNINAIEVNGDFDDCS